MDLLWIIIIILLWNHWSLLYLFLFNFTSLFVLFSVRTLILNTPILFIFGVGFIFTLIFTKLSYFFELIVSLLYHLRFFFFHLLFNHFKFFIKSRSILRNIICIVINRSVGFVFELLAFIVLLLPIIFLNGHLFNSSIVIKKHVLKIFGFHIFTLQYKMKQKIKYCQKYCNRHQSTN